MFFLRHGVDSSLLAINLMIYRHLKITSFVAITFFLSGYTKCIIRLLDSSSLYQHHSNLYRLLTSLINIGAVYLSNLSFSQMQRVCSRGSYVTLVCNVHCLSFAAGW